MRTLLRRSLLAIILVTGVAACGGGMHGGQDKAAGRAKLQSGIDLARSGITRYQTEQPTGLASMDEGRAMMGQGMVMMGLGCCIGDGSPAALGSTADRCASSMGSGAPAMVQGLGKFDGARSMMSQADVGVAQAMVDMEAAMQMMEQGATDMMGTGTAMGGGMM